MSATVQQTFGESEFTSGRIPPSVRSTAGELYHRTQMQGRHAAIASMLFGSPHNLRKLNLAPGAGHDAGLQTVPTRKILGSENRVQDFDAQFHPVQSRTRERWLSIAEARLMGAGLPAIELIELGGIYYVRDGHHRLSVARALGEEYIEAHVITRTDESR